MSELTVITNDDWRRSIATARRTVNRVAQRIRVKAGWPADLHYSMRVVSDKREFHFRDDRCYSTPRGFERYEGWSYDALIPDLNRIGITLVLTSRHQRASERLRTSDRV